MPAGGALKNSVKVDGGSKIPARKKRAPKRNLGPEMSLRFIPILVDR
jgi:hypothetical protein